MPTWDEKAEWHRAEQIRRDRRRHNLDSIPDDFPNEGQGTVVSLDEQEKEIRRELQEMSAEEKAEELIRLRIRRGALITNKRHTEVVRENYERQDSNYQDLAKQCEDWAHRNQILRARERWAYISDVWKRLGALLFVVALPPVLWVLKAYVGWWFPGLGW